MNFVKMEVGMKPIKMIGIVMLVVALGIVIIQNRAPVQTHFLLITIEMPHILLLLLTAGAGFTLGVVVVLWGTPRPKIWRRGQE